SAADIETVEEERVQWNILTQSGDVELAAEAPHRDLKRSRPTVLLKRNRFPIEDHARYGQIANRFDDFRHRHGDVVEAAREYADFALLFVQLDARAIELVLECCLAEPVQRLPGALGGLREHRRQRTKELHRHVGEGGSALGKQSPRDDTQA